MNRKTRSIDKLPILADLAGSRNKMTHFDQLINRFTALPRLSTLRCLSLFAALVTVAAPVAADAATRTGAGGAYDGTWNVVFATTRGNCSSGHSVPFTVSGSRVVVGGWGPGFRLGQPRRRGGRQRVGWCVQGQRRRPARRYQRYRVMERHHHR